MKVIDRVFEYTWLQVDSNIAKWELEEKRVPDLVCQASGIVVELGPGSGNQLSRYDASKVTKIYGIEPNVGLHDRLRVRIKESKLDDIYTIVPCGIENGAELEKYGISRESVDTVLTCQVLCSVPQPETTVRHMYRLLKPGGRLIAYEHIRSDDFVSRTVQKLYNLAWPYGMGYCHLDRPTEKYLQNAGSWSKIDLKLPNREDAWSLFPRVSGQLIK
ncbi:hypothetical protein MMC07_001729 [Pseudocyphellaria aurata]|nr:hypothetical protein [Pseudocyphellaria aurata]